MRRWKTFAALIFFLLISAAAHATNFSFTGTFTHDTDLQDFTFTLASDTAGVALRTWSYAGGTNAAGQVIPSGGFEPILNLYLADGTQMNPGQSGPCTIPLTGNPVADLLPDPTSGACADVYYPTTLSFPGGVWSAGTYIVVLSTFANPGIGNLSDGFFSDVVLGLPSPSNFTCEGRAIADGRFIGRHSRESGNPGYQATAMVPPWVPAFAGVTTLSAIAVHWPGTWSRWMTGVRMMPPSTTRARF